MSDFMLDDVKLAHVSFNRWQFEVGLIICNTVSGDAYISTPALIIEDIPSYRPYQV
jgi:hypothetical protein